MAKKPRPPKPPTPSDPHTAMMAGDMGGLRPDRRVTRAKSEPKPDEAPSRDQIRDEQEAKRWDERLTRSNKRYDTWSKAYECDRLDAYYEGKQWRGITEDEAKGKYVINLVFATVESQIPSLLFTKPKVKAEARPSHEMTPGNDAGGRATLIEQSIQTVFDDPNVHLGFESTLSLRDAYSRFGVVEVGYSADWLDNPNVGKPILKEDKTELRDEKDEPILEPKKVLRKGTKERVYIKRIDPASLRASSNRNSPTANDWIAYFEWVDRSDVRRNPDYVHAQDVEATGKLKDAPDADPDTQEEIDQRKNQVKIWRIFDLRRKMRYVHAEGHKHLLQKKPFTTFPLAVLKFYEKRNSFYPIPPIYNWLGPQDEINETREMSKVHRRRALRRYMHDGSVSPTEMEKLESGEDMVAINVGKTTPPPIVPIQDAPLHPQNTTEELANSKDDLNSIAGVTGETRNTPSSPTATQANIMNVRQSIRESRARQQVADWLAEIARLVLLVQREKMKNPWMVKRTVDPFAAFADPQHLAHAAKLWQEIESEDVDELDVDISIDVASLSPVAEDAQRNQWAIVLTLLSNPQLGPWLFTPHPAAPDEPTPLLRRTLTLNGITSDQEIREIWRVGQAILKQIADAAAAQAALAKAPEPPKVSVALKGEDIILAFGAIEGPSVIRALLGAEPTGAGPIIAAATSRPELPTGGSGAPAAMPGVTTGTPAAAPTGVA